MTLRLFALLILWQCAAMVFIAPPLVNATAVTVPFLMLNGYQLYDTITIQYAPGYFWLNAALASVLTEPLTRITVSQFALAALSTAILARMGGKWPALLYAVWSPVVLSAAFYFENLVGLLLLVAYWQRRKAFLCGLMLGCAILIKQQALIAAAWFFLAQAAPFRWHWPRWRSMIVSTRPSIGSSPSMPPPTARKVPPTGT